MPVEVSESFEDYLRIEAPSELRGAEWQRMELRSLGVAGLENMIARFPGTKSWCLVVRH